MKKFTSLLIGCALALAGAAFAQQSDNQQPTPTKGKKQQNAEKTERSEKAAGEKTHKGGGNANTNGANAGRGAGANVGNPDATTGKQPVSGTHNRNAAKTNKADGTPLKTEASEKTNASAETGASATVTPNAKQQARQARKGAKGDAAAENARTKASATPVAAATPATTPGAPANTAVSATTNNRQGNRQGIAGGAGMKAKRAEPQKLQQIKQEHASFRAQPRPDKVPSVSFQANYRIQGSDRWQGPQYEVYRSYHPERHDRSWYHSHYSRVELVGGGYYYLNNGYWYPAWGYNPSEEYYAYDAPIYVGHSAEPPDRVIADVQSELQEMGYYQGEVDGLLGPLTREALTAYQSEQGLESTAVIDEPTLDSLGMSS